MKPRFRDFWNFLFGRFNVVKIQTLTRISFHDRVEIMLHANFQILVDFIEKERPYDIIDTSHHKEIWDQIQFLYNWWKFDRPNRKSPYNHELLDEMVEKKIDLILDTEFWSKYYNQELENKYEAEDDEYLMQLIKLRRHLWC